MRPFLLSAAVSLIAAMLLTACGEPAAGPEPDAGSESDRVVALASDYVDGYYHQFPEEAYEVGYPDVPFDRLGDRGAAALEAWEAKEDAWLESLRSIDPAALEGTPAAIPYAFARERLEASRERRACRLDLWNVSPTWTGWQSMLASTFSQQPVGSDEARADALARARDVVRYLETEIANLRSGLEQGYSAPRGNVEAVIEQVDGLLRSPVEDSAFFEPAQRDGTPEFSGALRRIVEEEIRPAIGRYRDYLAGEYLDAARLAIGVTAQPGGDACYRGSIRFYTSLPLTPQEIHDEGLRQMERIQAEMQAIAERSFDTSDYKALLKTVRTDPSYTFSSEQAVVDYAQAAIDRAKAATPDWFGFMPRAEVEIRPYPAYLKRSGGGFYSAGAVDGSRPGTYELGTYAPETIPKAGMEATTFHETYPGHHLQVSIGLERRGVHPVLRYFFFSGTGEGWALYTERLADEMGLYSSDVDRLGLLANEAWRAARLVVDPGMHALGWTREQALAYLLENTTQSEGEANYEINRYLAVPAQATSYMTGSLEIRRLRSMAEERLGERFDVKAFHDRVIEDGTVTLGMLRRKIEQWIEQEES